MTRCRFEGLDGVPVKDELSIERFKVERRCTAAGLFKSGTDGFALDMGEAGGRHVVCGSSVAIVISDLCHKECVDFGGCPVLYVWQWSLSRHQGVKDVVRRILL